MTTQGTTLISQEEIAIYFNYDAGCYENVTK